MGRATARQLLRRGGRARGRHAPPRRIGAVRGLFAWVLVAAGAAMIAYPLLVFRFGSLAQAELLAEAQHVERRTPHDTRPMPLGEGALLGTIEIASVGLEVAFAEGVSDETLLAAPGHLPGSPLPGSPGASVVAAHRDLHFRDLHRVSGGDAVVVRTGPRVLRYRVDRIDVVRPDAAWVTAPARGSVIRLVTCWPPTFVGPAPERLVVSATLKGRSAGPAPPPSAPVTGPVAVRGTPMVAASATVGSVVSVMAFFGAWRGRRDRTTFAVLCTGAVLTAASLWIGGPSPG